MGGGVNIELGFDIPTSILAGLTVYYLYNKRKRELQKLDPVKQPGLGIRSTQDWNIH